jgi:sperm-associated antigen 1
VLLTDDQHNWHNLNTSGAAAATMAELGDLLTGGGGTSVKPREVEIDMLDYGYIDKCEDPQQLRAILHRLNSGKDGHYPDLIKHAEARLLEVLPVKERVRLLGLKAEPSHADVDAADNGLREWQASIKQLDSSLKQQGAAPVQLPIKQRAPPPRATVTTAPANAQSQSGRSSVLSGLPSSAAKKQQQQQTSVQQSKKESGNSSRLSGYDFKAWDKYDTDAAIQEIDDSEVRKATSCHSELMIHCILMSRQSIQYASIRTCL